MAGDAPSSRAAQSVASRVRDLRTTAGTRTHAARQQRTPTLAATSAWTAAVSSTSNATRGSKPASRQSIARSRGSRPGTRARPRAPGPAGRARPAPHGERVPGRQDRLVGVVEQVLQLEVRREHRHRHVVVDERQVGVARAQVLGRLARLGLLHRQLDVGWCWWKAATRVRRQRRTGRSGRRSTAAARRAGRPAPPARPRRSRWARDASAWPRAPSASVRRTPPAPALDELGAWSRSRAATCWEIADWVKFSDSAAAENEPQEATSRRTRMRRTSSIRAAYPLD